MQKTICLLLLIFFFFSGKTPILFAQTLTATENVTISATVGGGDTIPPETSGLGGSGVINIPKTSVRFSGEAYPGATVIVSKNGEIVTTVKASNDGLFSVTLEEKYDSTILYSLSARDIANNKSLLINYPMVVFAGYLTYLSGILFPPTITLDKMQVRLGDFLTVGGYALPGRELQIVIENQDKKTNKTFTLVSPDGGRYNITLPLMNLPTGNYSVYVKYSNDLRISKLIKFLIGDMNIKSSDTSLNISGDCNADGRINLVDFSVLAFWYKKSNPPICVDTNSDHLVDLTDFSILAFYWTN